MEQGSQGLSSRYMKLFVTHVICLLKIYRSKSLSFMHPATVAD